MVCLSDEEWARATKLVGRMEVVRAMTGVDLVDFSNALGGGVPMERLVEIAEKAISEDPRLATGLDDFSLSAQAPGPAARL